MHKYLCVFFVDGRKCEQTITARSDHEAKKNIEAQYSNSKITWASCRMAEW